MAGDAASRWEGPPRRAAEIEAGAVTATATAFAPGRVNLVGEHTDYNNGLALPFAIAEGVVVRAQAAEPRSEDERAEGAEAGGVWLGSAEAEGAQRIYAHARDLDEMDEFELAEISPAEGWRAYVRGVAAELQRAGVPLVGARLEIGGDLERGAGLSSSAALEVALCLALSELARSRAPRDVPRTPPGKPPADVLQTRAGAPGNQPADLPQMRAGGEVTPLDRIALARLCARVENDWVGAKTGMLDQLASLFGAAETALRVDFATLEIEPVPLRLGGWRFVVVDSGEQHANASSGYNERRAQCERACELLGVETLRDASATAVAGLPQPLRARAEHVLGENARVGEAVAALRAGDLPAMGRLLDASHASLRDLYEVSTPTVERAVARLREDGAAGARLMGGGFGGSVLGLFAPGVSTPDGGREVQPGPGAHVLSE
jgi:galactokinase